MIPPILYELGFEPTIEWIEEKIGEENNILIKFKSDKHPKPVDEDVGAIIYRSVHDFLINVVKHSQARSAEISISRKSDFVHIVVKDDGIGFDTKEIGNHGWRTTKFGLFSVREHIESIGGNIKIESEPSQGTTITLVVPQKHTETYAKCSKTRK